ncbi:MAG: SpoIIE family protein phosphatase [Trueperaceae bacterium]|nr:MAG: SpoIIE family protein phosphatase [Trueperaceae bacterium]
MRRSVILRSEDASAEKKAANPLDIGFYGRPFRGERVSGDATVVARREGLAFVAMIDVLGHGQEASVLASHIKAFLDRDWGANVTDTMMRLHQDIKGSRGAAAGLAVVDERAGELRYCGVGNTVLRRVGTRPTRLISREGVIGQQMRSPQQQNLNLGPSDVVLLYTDGVSDRFEVDQYPQLLYESAMSIARTVVQRFGKAHDDATCLALRYQP